MASAQRYYHGYYGTVVSETVLSVSSSQSASAPTFATSPKNNEKTQFIVKPCSEALSTGSAGGRTAVAGFSPHLANPQPRTNATLSIDANRLIRWQGWLNVDAFSISVLEQMQKQIESGDIEIGKFTMDEPSISEAVEDAKANCKFVDFVPNANLCTTGEDLTDVALYVWTYRHNHTDSGLYQFYISVKGTVLIGRATEKETIKKPHEDIQSLLYEFGPDRTEVICNPVNIYASVDIWRGAVVRVNARGEIELVGNEAGVITIQGANPPEAAPISEWEMALSLYGNPNYDPKKATGAPWIAPLEREIRIPENNLQKEVPINRDIRTIPVNPNVRF
jgi:hypothetical protein